MIIKGKLVLRKSMSRMRDSSEEILVHSCSVRKVNRPAIPLLGIHPKELKAGPSRDVCTYTFIAVLFIVAKRRKQPKLPSVDEYINKMWCMHTVEYYSALIKRKLMSPTIT